MPAHEMPQDNAGDYADHRIGALERENAMLRGALERAHARMIAAAVWGEAPRFLSDRLLRWAADIVTALATAPRTAATTPDAGSFTWCAGQPSVRTSEVL